MIIIIETPASLLDSITNPHGANKLSFILYNLFLTQTNHFIIVLTDLSNHECNVRNNELSSNANHFFINYESLGTYLFEENIVPDVALSFDIKLNRLLSFRHLHQFPFPVIGLIHSLGFESHINDLLSIKPLITAHDRLICPSENTQDTVLKVGFNETNTHVMHYGLDHTCYKPISNKRKQDLRNQLLLPLDKPVILFLSRISPTLKTDLTPFIRLMPDLLKINPNFIFYIVGSVIDSDYVKQLKVFVKELGLEDHVVWEHKPDHNAIEQYYQSSDIFLGLSDHPGETYGLTVMEAMSAGLPVLLSDHAAYKVHITHAKEGYYIPTLLANVNLNHSFYYCSNTEFGSLYSQSLALDNTVLIQFLSDLLSSPKKTLSMGKAARKKIESNHTLNHMFQRLMDLITTVVQDSHDKPSAFNNNLFLNTHELFSHHPTRFLSTTDSFCLTETTRNLLQQELDCFFFEKQLITYKLVTVIIHLLSEQDYCLKELCNSINASPEEVEQNCVFLLKQHIISLKQK